MPHEPIPLNDLKRHTASIIGDMRKALEDVLTSGQYTLGPYVERFESAFAAYCGVKHAVGVANGTDALELALYAAGCQAGDGVITVANAGGYATTAIFNAGAVPVYADIDPQTFLISPDSLQQAIRPGIKAVIVTHLYGLMADMPELCKIAAAHGIMIIEDCAQANGAIIAGKKAGSWGAFGCFSFYPTKNLGALGDAGCVVTADDHYAERLRSLRQYGWGHNKYHAARDIGRNSRMDELQAAMLCYLLPRLDGWNDKRRQIVNRYRKALSSGPVRFQRVVDEGSFAAHLCVIRTPDRDSLMQSLHQDTISAAVHYPVADYAQEAVIRRINTRTALPHTAQLIGEIFSLPCFPEMREDEVDRVITVIQRHYS